MVAIEGREMAADGGGWQGMVRVVVKIKIIDL